MKMRKQVLLLVLLAALFSACSQNETRLQDGYYSAVLSDFDDYGWKEYVTIYVSGGKIVTVEYNAKNASGFIKSWDMDYMRIMDSADGTYPNQYTRIYADALLNKQDSERIDAISGATHSYETFKLLAEAVLTQAMEGNEQVAFIDVPTSE